MDAPGKSPETGGGMIEFLKSHPGLAIGGLGAVILVLVVLSKSKAGSTGVATTTGDTSGLTNGTVYVPTSTNFYSDNSQGAISSFVNSVTNNTIGSAVVGNSNVTATVQAAIPVAVGAQYRADPAQHPSNTQ